MQKRIVIIDDDQLILDTAAEFLRNAGYQVATSDCPITSNSLIYTEPAPDLLIIDVMMPLMSGDSKLKKTQKPCGQPGYPGAADFGKAGSRTQTAGHCCRCRWLSGQTIIRTGPVAGGSAIVTGWLTVNSDAQKRRSSFGSAFFVIDQMPQFRPLLLQDSNGSSQNDDSRHINFFLIESAILINLK